jgi:hypothetical protein
MNRLLMEQGVNTHSNVSRFGLILSAVAILYIIAVILFIIVY